MPRVDASTSLRVGLRHRIRPIFEVARVCAIWWHTESFAPVDAVASACLKVGEEMLAHALRFGRHGLSTILRLRRWAAAKPIR
jgi:hypothetical protein